MKNFQSIYVKPLSNEEVNKIAEDIENQLNEYIKSGKYKELLLRMSNLYKYSFTNQIYILMQMESATTVNGLKQWNKLGRNVIKGSKSIKIIAPITKKVKVQVSDMSGNYILDENGIPIVKEEEKVVGYKPSFVFDISQTDGEQYESFQCEQRTNVEKFDQIMNGIKNVITKNNFSYRYASKYELGEGVEGCCNHKRKEILLLEGLDQLQTISVFIHEAGHCLAHGSHIPKFDGLTNIQVREIKEVEAESISCIVCSYLGLDTKRFNFDYITSWSRGDISKFRRNLDTICKYSRILLESIDSELLEKIETDFTESNLNQTQLKLHENEGVQL